MCIISVNGEWVTPRTKSLSLTCNTHSGSQESFHLLKNLAHKKNSMSLDPTLSQMIQVYNIITHLSKINFNIILPLSGHCKTF